SVKPLFKRFQRFEKPLYDMKDRSLKANWYYKHARLHKHEVTKNGKNTKIFFRAFRFFRNFVFQIRTKIEPECKFAFRSFSKQNSRHSEQIPSSLIPSATKNDTADPKIF
ncbi:MAG: hypothetical protein BWK80_35945, partial [Desulfobacteraceae bacterium IS3]